jgi:hypothetical protein
VQVCQKYKDLSRQTISRFLQLDGFGLFGVDSFPSPFDHLTLGNGRHMITSGRDRKERKHKIGHGMWIQPETKDLGYVLKTVKENDWLSALISSGLIFATKDDPRTKLLEALVAGFAVPMFTAVLRQLKKSEAERLVLDIGGIVARELEGASIPFVRLPESRPLTQTEAQNEADKILALLEGVSANLHLD